MRPISYGLTPGADRPVSTPLLTPKLTKRTVRLRARKCGRMSEIGAERTSARRQHRAGQGAVSIGFWLAPIQLHPCLPSREEQYSALERAWVTYG